MNSETKIIEAPKSLPLPSFSTWRADFLRGINLGRFSPSPNFILCLYFASIVVFSFVHKPLWLGGFLGASFILCGKKRINILKKTLFAALPFTGCVSVAYSALSLWQGTFSADYLYLVNTRVLLLVFLGFWLISTLNLSDSLASFPLLRLVATLATSQIKTFERLLAEAKLAFQSRNVIKPNYLAKMRHASAKTHTLFDKSLASSEEVTLAMRSRGAFEVMEEMAEKRRGK